MSRTPTVPLLWTLLPLLLSTPLAVSLEPPTNLLPPSGGRGALEAGGAFTCDFGLPPDFPLESVAPTIERDRMYMAERPGMLHKHIPFVPAPQDGVLYSGGRYLFDTEDAAKEYLRWVREDFALDDVLFLERSVFLEPDCHAWATVGAHEWGSLRDAQVVMRTERWIVDQDAGARLASLWPAVRQAAAERGFSAVWLLHDEDARLASLVYFADRLVPGQLVVHPMLSLLPLAVLPPLGDATLDATGWSRVFDRTHFVLTTWFPFAAGDHGEPALWLNSPPLPEPTTSDGVCEVSRGENAHTAPSDCLPTCGNAVEDEGETTRDCPGDVRPYWTRI